MDYCYRDCVNQCINVRIESCCCQNDSCDSCCDSCGCECGRCSCNTSRNTSGSFFEESRDCCCR